ncbi:hypothetical protein Vadar_028071 [Vaccinium darrowii]|uniref:Uncharacterized protein n=1 Tax=Vaccinium darrowii TaxID=229202 RepID=A0ACB7YZV2_9ERIC|nr:hypothetical protein Vadar_028071 [Vaccinium darrowii]
MEWLIGDGEIIKKLLDRNKELIDQADAQGWTPLHYAAYCGDKKAVRELLQRNNSVGYTRTTESHDNGIALHIAAAAGYEDVMEEILSHCLDCWEMVNSNGKNILHIAVNREAECVVDYIIQTEWLESLMNQKDVDGNTPLHLLAFSEMKDKYEVINHRRANMYAVNNQNKTPAEVAMSIKENNRSSWFSKAHGRRNVGSNEEQKVKMTKDSHMERERKESKEVKAGNITSQSHMLVATLIASITFTAGFAVPGSYDVTQGTEEGMAVLVREAGFKAFVLANTVAVMCSTSSVLCYVFAALYDDDDKKAGCYMNGFSLVLIAVVAMTVGFLSGTYAMLVHSLGLAIATSIIASITFVIYFCELIRLFGYIKFQEFVAKSNT